MTLSDAQHRFELHTPLTMSSLIKSKLLQEMIERWSFHQIVSLDDLRSVTHHMTLWLSTHPLLPDTPLSDVLVPDLVECYFSMATVWQQCDVGDFFGVLDFKKNMSTQDAVTCHMLHGEVDHCFFHGRKRFYTRKQRFSDVLSEWLLHLCYCAVGGGNLKLLHGASHVIYPDKQQSFLFQPVSAIDSLKFLQDWFDFFMAGNLVDYQPLSFFNLAKKMIQATNPMFPVFDASKYQNAYEYVLMRHQLQFNDDEDDNDEDHLSESSFDDEMQKFSEKLLMPLASYYSCI